MTASKLIQYMPDIIVSDADRDRLLGLAQATMNRAPDAADELMFEIERATVLPLATLPPNVVRMGSTVVFKIDGAPARRATLVFPGDADISHGRISVLTPVGTALIGLSEGQSFRWTTRDGRDQRLTVQRVEAPASTDASSGVIDFAIRGAAKARRKAPAPPPSDDPGPAAA